MRRINLVSTYSCRDFIPLYYWNAVIDGQNNFGDLLSKYLVEKITNKKVNFTQRESFGKLLAIGSLIDYTSLYSKSYIWGTGSMMSNPIRKEDLRRGWLMENLFRKINRSEICALRGPLTGQIVESLNFEDPKVYGDPAILLPDFYQPVVVRKKNDVGLVLHWSQEIKLQETQKEELTRKGIYLISILRSGDYGIEEFVREILSCEKVFSTSLHGVIVSQAYGIPAQWITLEGTEIHPEAELKFKDYFLGSGQEVQVPKDFSFYSLLSEVFYRSPPSIMPFYNKSELLKAFPRMFK